MILQAFSNWFTKHNALKAFAFVVIAASFSACGGDDLDDYYNQYRCLPTEEEKLAVKPQDIQTIKKYFRDNNIDTTAMQETASGIHYFVLEEGTGAEVEAGDRVEVHYVGKFIDGSSFSTSKTFDNSYERASPLTITVGAGEVIKGWDEALQLMKVGENTLFYIPSYLAYGICGNNSIPPNTVLAFDIKVLRKL
ncbi:FKBP-type peptidyl-prolyl cis-trans isomerase [Pontibacter harenae]|uniref:FKBP-type peptidyl-prolyl cis-trans isomerase n=1 Tax=Pontibacter harenae TaxID=2894083 RepID=UPI001E5D3001|nr:FKBP-type peptidyl-prolyl cis-trans isomerase [Pontibacter harenae]MCC9167791.1 FKBP-type peptidyl-prolyl cis-trans isomerase [Pontibacter harenae]